MRDVEPILDPDREVELKLELAPGDARRVLGHPAILQRAIGPAETHDLRSVYFDTPELALASEGIALRLRSTGATPQQTQTVKLGDHETAGLFVREEIEVEVTGERPDLDAIPDEALRARLRELLAGRRLEPVFETEVRRTHLALRDDSAEWSLDLDEGEVRAGSSREPICELELELRSGSTASLYELAIELSSSLALWPGTRSKADRGRALRTGERPHPTRAGAVEIEPDATLGVALHQVALSCLSQISTNAAPAYEGADLEGVHQMRVGVRRMRSLLSVFRPLLPPRQVRSLRDRLRWLAGELGAVRDLDVFVEELLEPLFRLRADDAALKRLRNEALALREERKQALRTALRSRRQTRLLLELGYWIALSSQNDAMRAGRSILLSQPAEDFANAVLTRLHRKASKLGGAALVGPPETRHELRIALKKLRYACEFFRSLYREKEAKRYLRRLAPLQDLLGALNDADTAGRVLQELLARVEPFQAESLARAAGLVEGFAARADELALRELGDRWERFERARIFWEEA